MKAEERNCMKVLTRKEAEALFGADEMGGFGYADLSGTDYECFEDGEWIFESDLILTGSKIKHLPRGIEIGLALKAAHSQLQELPEDLDAGYIDISHTVISKLPTSLHVVGTYDCGSIDVSGSKITDIPYIPAMADSEPDEWGNYVCFRAEPGQIRTVADGMRLEEYNGKGN